MNRSEFLKLLCAFPFVSFSNTPPRRLKKNENDLIFGWTTCLTYQTEDKKLGFQYYSKLLDEMYAHGMKRLIVMMASHGYFSPKNHGLAWPVKNKRLKPQLDKNALNAVEETEFFSKIIDKAHSLSIRIFIEIKYLGMIGIDEGYPGIEVLTRKNGQIIHKLRPEASDYERKAIETLHICCDNEQAHQYMRDKVTDVLTRYKNLDGIVFEHPSYARNTCYCKGTQRRLKNDKGKSIDGLSNMEYKKWKAERIRDTLLDLKKVVKSVNPKFEVGFYTGFSPSNRDIKDFQTNRGHDPKTLKQVGFDFLLPYCEGRHQENETGEIERVINYLDFPEIYLHTTIRRDPPVNYPLPPKGPEYVKSIIKWGKDYATRNSQFKGMTFFNEVKIPEENRQAVYDSIS